MQKLINFLALASFAVSASVVGAGAYIYMNREALAEKARERVMDSLEVSQLGQTLLSGPAAPEVPGTDSLVPSVPSVPGLSF